VQIFKDAKAAKLTTMGAGARAASARAVASGILRAASPVMAVGFTAQLLGVNELAEEGSVGDQIAEGALIGASFGAAFGGVGALVGAPIGMGLNLLTGGVAANVIQESPLGLIFGRDKEEPADLTAIAAEMYYNAAVAQGVDNPRQVADGAAAHYASFNKLIDAGAADPAQRMQFILDAGRMGGLSGFPWNPEELTPVYSPEDIASITEAVTPALQPVYDVAEGLASQTWDHVEDEKIRAQLIESSHRAAANMMDGIGVTLQAPATAAILTEGQRRQNNQTLADQTSAFAQEFAALGL